MTGKVPCGEGLHTGLGTVGEPTDRRRSASSASRRVAMMISALLLAVGLAAGPATPAGAAPASAQTTVCFQAPIYFQGVFYGWGPYNRTVILDVWSEGRAHQVMTLTPGTNGCMSYHLLAGYYWRYRVFHFEAGKYFTGQTNWQYVTAGYTYNFGTLRVNMT